MDFYNEYVMAWGYEKIFDEKSIPKMLFRDVSTLRIIMFLIMKKYNFKITLSCEEFIKDCTFMGQKQNCSKIFALRTTYNGYCCAFNYVRPHVNNMLNETIPSLSPIKVTKSGINNGLELLIDNDLEDYFFSTLPTVGVTVQIFNSKDFPDQASGSFTELILPAGHEMFVNIHGVKVKATPELRKHSIKNVFKR